MNIPLIISNIFDSVAILELIRDGKEQIGPGDVERNIEYIKRFYEVEEIKTALSQEQINLIDSVLGSF